MTDYTLALDAARPVAGRLRRPLERGPAAREVGTAALEQAVPKGFDVGLAAIALQVVGNIALGVISNVIYDLLKQAVARARERDAAPITPPELIDVQEIALPDGNRLLIVKVRE
ncbi:MAG: hypothetical protein HZY76_03770 [Anaerolineae bacterium]|nr:MAG: hypothetical protein HZY76_03770 [Anaerolineae bacterium]